MSHNMLEHPSGLYVTRFAGPARDDGKPRTAYQITTRAAGYAQLTSEQWQALIQVCVAIAKLDNVNPAKPGATDLWPNAKAGIYGDVSDLVDSHESMLEALLQNTPNSWDGDDAAESIVVDYVRHLESEVKRLGGSTERSFS